MICYALRAKDVLGEAGGEMTDAGLHMAIDRGDQARTAYYAGRVDGIPAEDIEIVAQVFSTMAVGDTIYKKEMIDALRAVHSDKVVEDMFEDLLHRGVIAQTEHGLCDSPIPSFHRWILDNFGRECTKSRTGV